MAFNLAQARIQFGIDRGSLTRVTREVTTAIGGIKTRVKLETRTEDIQRIRGEYAAMAKSAREAEKATQGIGRSLLGVGLAGAAIAKVSSEIRQAASAAIDYQKEMTKLRQVSDDASSDVAAVGREVSNLSQSLGVSSGELIRSANTLKQAGLSARETKDALASIAQASLAPNFESMRQTTEGAIAVFRQFNVSASQLGATLGSINAVSGAYAAEASDLITAIQKAGGAFAATGGQLNELLALMTSVRSTTREDADSIATSLRTIFSSIQRPQTVEALAALGINLRSAEGQAVSTYEAIGRLNAGLAGLKTTDPRYAMAVEAVGGLRNMSKTIPLIQQYALAQQALNVARAGGASLEIASQQAQEATATRLTKLQEKLYAVVRTFGESREARVFGDGLEKVANSAIALTSALGPLLPLLGAVGLSKGLGLIGFGGLTKGRAALGVGLGAAALGTSYAGSALESRYGPSGAAVSGAATGALTGGVVGFGVGGPYGAAIGAAVGGLQGFTSALHDAKQAVLDRAIDDGQAKLANAVSVLGTGQSPTALADANASVRAIRAATAAKAKNDATSAFGASFDVGDYLARSQSELRKGVGPSLVGLVQSLNKQAEGLGQRSPNADPAALTKELQQTAGDLLSAVADLQGKTRSSALGDFRSIIEVAQRAARPNGIAVESTRQASAYGRLTDAVARSGGGLPDIAALGRQGQRLAEESGAADRLANVLPSILSALSLNEGDTPSTQIRESAKQALGGRLTEAESRGVDVVAQQLDRRKLADVRDAIEGDVSALADELLKGFSGAVQDARAKLASAIREGEGQLDRLADLRLGAARTRAEVEAERTGRPAGDALPLPNLLRPFQERQERLSGLKGEDATNPEALAKRLAAVETERLSATGQHLDDLTSQADRLREALETLTKSNTAAAAIQEKLSQAALQRDSRLSYAEKFYLASPEQKGRMKRGQALVGAVDSGRADFAGLSDANKRLFLESANELGQTRLRSGRTGESLKAAVLGQQPGVRDAKVEDELRQLRERQVKLADEAVKAEELGRAAKAAALKAELRKAAIADKTVELGASSRKLAELRENEKGATLLRQAGVTTDSQLEVLRGNRSELGQYAAALAGEAAVDATRERVRGRSSDFATFQPGDDALDSGFIRTGRLGQPTLANAEQFLSERFGDDLTAQQRANALKSFSTNGLSFAQQRKAEGGDVQAALQEALKASVFAELAATAKPYAEDKARLGDRFKSLGFDRAALTGAIGSDGGKGFIAAVDSFTKENKLETLGQRIADTSKQFAELEKAIGSLREAVKPAAPGPVPGLAAGGVAFAPRGTDTVPAMLTPDEFVINARSARANMGLLRKVNAAKGPVYLARGGFVDPDEATKPASRPEGGFSDPDAATKAASRPEGDPATTEGYDFARKPRTRPETAEERESISRFDDTPLDLEYANKRRRALPFGLASRREAFGFGFEFRKRSEKEKAAFRFIQNQAANQRSFALGQAIARAGGDAAMQGAVAQRSAERDRVYKENFGSQAFGAYARVSGDRFNQRALAAERKKARGYADGGLVPGNSTTDNVPAMLAGGEFVFNRHATAVLGAGRLAQIQRFANGGLVGGGGTSPASGGAGGLALDPAALAAMQAFNGTSQTLAAGFGKFASGASSLAQAMGAFGTDVDKLASVVERFPNEITMTGNQTVIVTVTAPDVFNGLGEYIGKVVAEKTRSEIDAAFKTRLPDAPQGARSDPTRVS